MVVSDVLMSVLRNTLGCVSLSACLLAGTGVASGELREPVPRGLNVSYVEAMLARAPQLGPIHSLVVSRDGVELVARSFAGPGVDRPANIKSVSKTVQAALAGIAIERGVLRSTDQPIVELLNGRVPAGAGPQIAEVTLDHLLSMRAGLASTSGANYGRWVASDDWVDFVLTRPFVDAPGARMQYSTGVWHVLSAILTERSGETLLSLTRSWLGQPLDITIPAWPRDPQGIYFGGNDMLISPRDLLAFGELFLNDGEENGDRVLPPGWIEQSWTPRARSPWSGHDYGYGWFVAELAGARVYYGRGYGGQLLHVIPELGIVVVITSRSTPPSAGGRYVRALHDLVAEHVIAGARAYDQAVMRMARQRR